MPLPFDNTTTLQSVAAIIERLYRPGFLEQPFAMGSATMRMLSFSKEPVMGAGEYLKFERWIGEPFRFSNDPLGDFHEPSRFEPSEVEIRFNERNPSANDLSRLAGSIQISDYELDNVSTEGQTVSIAKQLGKNMRKDFARKLAASMRLSRSGAICQTATATYAKRKGDGVDYGACSAYTSGDTSMCVILDEGATAMIFEGAEYDFYNGSSPTMERARCTRVNFFDAAAGPGQCSAVFERGGTTASPATANFDGVGDNNVLYFQGSRNAMPWSPEAWFADTSTSFIGGVNRQTPAYGYLNPNQLRKSTSAVAVTAAQPSKQHLDQVGDALAQMFDSKIKGYVVAAHQSLITVLRDQFDAAALRTVPTNGSGGERQANMGSISLAYQHPTLGEVTFEGDPFMKPDHIDMLLKGDWFLKFKKTKDLRIMPGDAGLNGFYRMQASTAGAGKGMHYRMDGYSNYLAYCTRPRAQARINSLAAA